MHFNREQKKLLSRIAIVVVAVVPISIGLYAYAQGGGASVAEIKSALKRGDTRSSVGTVYEAAMPQVRPIEAPFSAPVDGVIPGATVEYDKSGRIRRIRGSIEAVGKTPQNIAANFLQAHRSELQVVGDLRLDRTVETRMGTHLTYTQTLNGVPVKGGLIQVHVGKDQKVFLVNSDLITVLPNVRFTKPGIAGQAVIDAALISVPRQGPAVSTPVVEPMVLVEKGTPRGIFRVTFVTHQPPADWEVLLDASSLKPVRVTNQAQYVDGSGMIFDVNAVVVTGIPGLTDNNNADSTALTNARSSVVLKSLDGSGFLNGPYVNTQPTSGRVNSPTNVFNYTRSQGGFEETMVYYHLDMTERYIQSLGFNNINNRSIGANVNGITDDNSFYSPSTKQVTFGTGGVDDAEDADVVLHEYGHSIQDNEVPGWGQTEEGGAMGEGFGDYWAGSYSSGRGAMGNAWDVFLAEWDAVSYNPGNPGYLRRLDTSKHYPENMDGEVHDDGEIWSACLWQVRGVVGRTRADTMILQSHFLLTPNASFADGANAIIAANHALYSDADKAAIKAVFVNRGILQALSAPSQATAVQSANNVVVSWQDNSDTETGFRIERCPRGGTFSEVGSVLPNVTTYSDPSAVPGTSYAYRVRASSAEGFSPYSNSPGITQALTAYSIGGKFTTGKAPVQAVISASATGSFSYLVSTPANLAIPDNNSVGITSSAAVPMTGTITGVSVGVNVTHTYIGDLEISLIHPDGTTVLLHNRTGSGTDDLWTAYPSPTAPAQSLTVLNGKASNGVWKLKVRDLASIDVGTLNEWYVTITFNGTQTATFKTGKDGVFSLANLLPGAYTLTPLGKHLTTFTPANRVVTVGPNQVNQNFTVKSL